MRFFSILAAFLVISLSLLFLNRLPITEKLLAGRIEAIGGSNIQVTVSTLSSSELTVTSLGAAFPEDSSVQSIQLRDLTLSFSFSDLLKGKVAGLKIAGLQIKLGKKKQKSETTFSYQTLHELLERSRASGVGEVAQIPACLYLPYEFCHLRLSSGRERPFLLDGSMRPVFSGQS